MNPKTRAITRVQSASAALWRLARAREAFGFASPSVVELTAWVPPEGLPIYTASEYQIVRETVAELRAQAAKEQIEIFAASDVHAACERLLNKEGDARVYPH